MEPTLFSELVDRTEPERPVVMARAAVEVLLDDTRYFRTASSWTVRGSDVLGGHRLFCGDVVVGVDRDTEQAWLCEVLEASGPPGEHRYVLDRLERTDRSAWVFHNRDTRWAV